MPGRMLPRAAHVYESVIIISKLSEYRKRASLQKRQSRLEPRGWGVRGDFFSRMWFHSVSVPVPDPSIQFPGLKIQYDGKGKKKLQRADLFDSFSGSWPSHLLLCKIVTFKMVLLR
jgi:hypothetical protein